MISNLRQEWSSTYSFLLLLAILVTPGCGEDAGDDDGPAEVTPNSSSGSNNNVNVGTGVSNNTGGQGGQDLALPLWAHGQWTTLSLTGIDFFGEDTGTFSRPSGDVMAIRFTPTGAFHKVIYVSASSYSTSDCGTYSATGTASVREVNGTAELTLDAQAAEFAYDEGCDLQNLEVENKTPLKQVYDVDVLPGLELHLQRHDDDPNNSYGPLTEWDEVELELSPEQLSCWGVLACVDTCQEDDCVATCIDDKSSDGGRDRFMTLVGCIDQHSCESDECIEENCLDEAQTCAAHSPY